MPSIVVLLRMFQEPMYVERTEGISIKVWISQGSKVRYGVSVGRWGRRHQLGLTTVTQGATRAVTETGPGNTAITSHTPTAATASITPHMTPPPGRETQSGDM